VLQVAAVCGRIFRQRVVEQLVPDLARADSLGVLERESFILSHSVQPEPTYAFRHALIQEVAYNGQLLTQRRVTHAAIGEALEVIYGDRLDELVSELAFHYGQSANDEKALHWLVRAGDRAKALFANTEALTQYRAALQRVGGAASDSQSAGILERIGEVEALVGRYDDAIGSFRDALGHCESERGGLVARLQRRLGTAFLAKGRFSEAEQAFASGKSALVARDDPEAGRLEMQIGQLRYRRGEFGAARSALGRAIEEGERLGADDLIAEATKQLGNVAVDMGDLRDAQEHYQRAQRLYERLEDLQGLADMHSNLGIIYRRTARWDQAL
jgi:tetratricopeptide (TPR) repeat protein